MYASDPPTVRRGRKASEAPHRPQPCSWMARCRAPILDGASWRATSCCAVATWRWWAGWPSSTPGGSTTLEVLMGAGPRTVQRTRRPAARSGPRTHAEGARGGAGVGYPDGGGDDGMQLRVRCLASQVSGQLNHVAAVNDVRLHVQGRAPPTEWIPERVLARDRLAGEHLPDGVAITDGRRSRSRWS